jgi:two-component system response regulator AtoC
MAGAKSTILVCDDEELIRWSLATHLEQEGYTVHTVTDGQECVDHLAKNSVGLVIMDLKMPRKDGLTTLRELRAAGHEVPVIVLTAHGGVETAIEATRLGAAGYLAKPFDMREISLAVEKTLAHDRLKHEVHYLRRRERAGYGDFIGGHPVLQSMFETLRRLETVDAPTVLILGESGTGKDVVARAIHSRGPRRAEPFVAVDCAALPEQLIESELFGHERGSFTDAKAMKPGLFEIAERGMVFLDEIGELPLVTQSKLLRAIEDRSFRRVGGVRSIRLDAGLVAATNRNLKEWVEKGTFREDLFFRLDVISIRIPPLRDRPTDIPLLVEHFLEKYSKHRRVGVDGEAMQLLQQYRFPGNVRELRNLIERLVLLGPEDVVRAEHLPPEIRFARASSTSTGKGCPFELPEEGVDLEAVERGLLTQALGRTNGNQSAAARLLGISRYALRYRMEKFGLAT